MENVSQKRGPASTITPRARKRRLDPNAEIIAQTLQKGVCVSTRLLPDVLQQLDELAKRRGLSRGHLVRELVQEGIENEGVAAG